ncbi:enoyl-CoA hydratase/isomerase family protein [Brevundimonas aveniformis]|uniref:enoyl-CoA hydratase/isomerase family protein n=1 Tax=Brevundimonas aveniformis TaxID=370977 RepID=UPI0004113BEF|nr:enoyl-CoA hydratase/isomerase family protein [Brevundimonas aveniformis]
MTEPEVLTSIQNGVGRITLNRPRALNALNRGMCEIMTEALLAWRDDNDVRSVLIDHAGERGFCAGGDIRMIAESGAGDAVEAKAFFLVEYRLNDLMVRYPKPIVAVMDGIVMGGGVGISDPAPVRVVTERTLYAMPETGIGLFPDVGGGWFLPRMPGQTGIWLALTGARIKAADCLPLEVGTHFIPADQIEAFKLALIETDEAPQAVADRFARDPGASPLDPHREAVDRCFVSDTVEEIFSALEGEGSSWAEAQLAMLKTKSPQSLKVSLRQMRAGAEMATFGEVMAMEYALGGRVVQTHDFQEGVRSVIVDKDNAPHWGPSTLAGVTDAMLDAFFAPLPAAEAWTPLD